MRSLSALVLALCVLATPSFSRARGNQTDWGNLRLLQAGQKIQVIEKNGARHSGRFSSVDEQGITLHEESGDQVIARTNVLRVNAGGHRKRNTLLGLAIGAGAGAGIGAAAGGNSCASSAPYCINVVSRVDWAGIFAIVGGTVGAIVGVLIPSHKTIYRAQP